MRIKEVELKYFKFHQELTVDFNGKSLLIYGENGTGKSSIYEALYSNFYHQKRLDKYMDISITYKNRNFRDESLEVNIDFDSSDVTLNRNDSAITNFDVLEMNNIKPTIYFANERVLNRLVKENFYITLKDTLVEHFPNLKEIERTLEDKFEEVRRWKNDIKHEQRQSLKKGIQPKDYDSEIGRYKDNLNNELPEINKSFIIAFEEEVQKDEINKIIKDNFDENFSISFDFQGAEIPTTSQNLGLDFEISLPIIKIKIDDIECNGKLSQHFNEAKLKLVGVAIYFALAKKYEASGDGFKLLVLDDFLTSLDMSNRKLIMKYILEEFKDYQKLILTHNLQFFNMTRKMIDLNSEDKKQWKIQKLFVHNNQAFLYDKDISYLKEADDSLSRGDEHSAGNFIRKEFERITTEFEQLLELGRVEDLQNIIDSLKSKDKHYIYSHKVTNAFYSDVQKTLQDTTKEADVNLKRIQSAFKKLNQAEIEFTQQIKNEEGLIINETIKAIIKRGEFYKNFILNPTSHDDTQAEIYKKECDNAIKILKYLNTIINNLKGTKYE